MSSETVAKVVGKKLRHYFEVKRLEDGFDLSGVNQPQLNHPPLKSRATLQYDGLHDRALKHYFSQAEVKTRITQMHPTDGELREDDIKRLLKRYMYKYRFIHPTMPEWMYRHHPTQGRAIKAELVGFGVGLPTQKHKRIKGGFPVLRTVPSRSITRGEAQRLIDVATKILVATEHVNHIQTRPVTPNHKKQAAPKPFEKKKRVSSAKYTWDIDGRRHIRVRSYDDSFIPDWLIMQRREEKKEEESDEPATPQPSPRPKSAKYRQRDPTPSPPRPIVINVPETSVSQRVVVNQGSQTVDDVGIQTEKKLLEEYDHTEEEVKDGPWCEYQVYVRTGDRVGAATKAEVKVTLYGEKGRTKEVTLGKSSQNKVKFQRGKEDIFVFPAHHVGKLRKIKIGHDRTELNYAWYVDSVSVSDMHDKRIYDFPCHTWLSGRDGDKKTYKEFTLDGERAFVEAFKEARERSYPSAGRDRNKGDNSSESKASKNDKGSQESLRGSRGESDDSSRSTSSMSSSSSSRGRRTPVKSPAKPAQREVSPPRKTDKDEFFDSKVSGPTFTFRNSKDETTDPEEFLSGYKAGLEAVSAEQKNKHASEDRAKKRVLDGATIHDAARTGDMDRMQKLFDNFPDMKESKDEAGLTPLHIASTHGRLDIVKWLTALGVNLNTETQTGYTAIHLAASNGHLNCIIVLAAMGAKLTCLSVDMQTPLHLAAMNGHLECVKWLIANRASLSATDQHDRSALALAEEYQQKEVAAFIHKCIQEENDPNSSLYSLRKSHNGLGTIQEDSRREGSSQWRDDEKRRLYEEQQQRLERTHTSFLDSIRDEVAE